MTPRDWIAIWCFGVVATISSVGSAICQDQPPLQYTVAEFNAYQSARGQKDLQGRLTRLDDFVAKYPESVLIPFIYQDYYATYFSMKDYPKAVEYVDRYVSAGGNFSLESRLSALLTRGYAYYLGCGETAFHTPQAYSGVKNAAEQGFAILDQLRSSSSLTDEQFLAQRNNMRTVFYTVSAMAESGLKDLSIDPCKDAPVLDLSVLTPGGPIGDPRVFDRMIERLKALDVQNPPHQ